METTQLAHELAQIVSGEVRFDQYSRAIYSTDASNFQIEPLGVVIPRTRDDVIATIKLAAEHGVPVLPRGGGTSLAGQTVGRAVVIDMSKYMNNLIEINQEELWARVQPGIVLDELNHRIKDSGLFFTPDPATASRSNVGGAIGNNSCGSHSVLYGKTVDHVIELETVLSNGDLAYLGPLATNALQSKLLGTDLEAQIYRQITDVVQRESKEIESRYPKIQRRVGGYNLDTLSNQVPFNLSSLIVGSEGTLAAVTEAKLNLVRRPTATGLIVAHFQELAQALEAAVLVLEHNPSAVELLGELILQQMKNAGIYARKSDFIEGTPSAVLLIEASGDSDKEVHGKLESMKAALRKSGLGYAFLVLDDRTAQSDVWEVRKAGLGLMMRVEGDAKPIPFIEDCSVSPENLPEYIRRVDEIIRANGTTAGYYGHASVGCIHVRPFINLKDQSDIDRMYQIARDTCELVLELDGAMSGEHGDGLLRSMWNEKVFGKRLYDTFREVKTIFDPKGIMNPGKIVDTQTMVENLRYGPQYKAIEPKTKLDFSREGGFHRAVEMCNGVGACRHTLGGTMCPSYMATRDEEHSTRGRANALRAALSGLLPKEEFTSQRMYDVLDLCLECKGCKAECPSGVDMAKVKYEFLDAYHQKNGYSIRSRLFANISTFSRIGSALAPLSNWKISNPITKWILDRILKIDKRRLLPKFDRHSFPSQFKARASSYNRPIKGKVVLFNDTFMNYNQPSIGIAATRLLESSGYEVVIVDRKCCGRPFISKGMLDKAKNNAEYNVDLLYPYVEQGAYVVGCEPSCLLSLRDEYPDLVPGIKATTVAENTFLIEEFLQKLHREGTLDLQFQQKQQKVLFHGHCHAKALVGNEPALETLSLIPGLEVQDSNAGCCGMAGAFGYEKEHYDVSMAIGNQRLFPQINDLDREVQIIANGMSCRQQVIHGSGRHPKHIVEILAEALI